jgi:hypothetical protein
MFRFRALLLAIVVVLGGNVTWSSSASADESPSTEALIQRGIQLRRTGDDEAALAVFLQAESESPTSVRVLLHIVTAAQAAGKWLMANEYMQRVSQDKNDAYYRRHRSSIEQVEAAITQRVGQFQALGAPEGAEIRLNGEAIGKLPMAEPKSLETGTYVMEVVSPGFYNLRRPISITGGVLTREAVELRERKAEALDASGAAGAGAGGMRERPEEWWHKSWVTWTLAGVGLATAAVSATAFIIRERQADKWNDEGECITNDAAVSRQDACGTIRDDIRLAQNVGIATGVAAVAFTGAALAHWAATSGGGGGPEPAPTASKKAPTRSVGVACAPGLMGIACQGSF